MYLQLVSDPTSNTLTSLLAFLAIILAYLRDRAAKQFVLATTSTMAVNR